MTTPPAAGTWVSRWLSPPRHAVYLAAADGDEVGALALYEWNAQVSAALLRDLAHVEVALRNAYDRELARLWPGPPHWTAAPELVFAPLYRTRGDRRVDVNLRQREALQRALAGAGRHHAVPGKVVAELMFGFWRYLSSAAHEKSLWVPGLYRAFAPGTDRKLLDGAVGRLHDLRNRVAHHEPILGADIATRLADAIGVVTLIDPLIGQHVAATTQLPALLTRRP